MLSTQMVSLFGLNLKPAEKQFKPMVDIREGAWKIVRLSLQHAALGLLESTQSTLTAIDKVH